MEGVWSRKWNFQEEIYRLYFSVYIRICSWICHPKLCRVCPFTVCLKLSCPQNCFFIINQLATDSIILEYTVSVKMLTTLVQSGVSLS